MHYYPVFDSFDENKTVAGLISAPLFWTDIFETILPQQAKGIFVVLENECDQVWSYKIDGPMSLYLGIGDLHDTQFDYLELTAPLGAGGAGITFLVYDCVVEKRQKIVTRSAMRTDAVVSSLFPDAFKERLYDIVPGRRNKSQKRIENHLYRC